ncbi:MAG: ATP-NAD kinase family protein [Desulfurococcales archaeon]|nr:ATP-NAD kinase family protein [Desulfurococcales archaeon]
MRIGFLINPISGTGGLVGLKGTDSVFMEAIKRGGIPISYRKALVFLKHFALLGCGRPERIEILVPPRYMGYNIARYALRGCDNIILRGISFPQLAEFPSTREHTIHAVKEMLEAGIDTLVFVGGDGTARDVLEAMGNKRVPVLGVPAGVKVYSAVFAYTPRDAAEILNAFVNGSSGTRIEYREVVDWISLGDEHYKVFGYLPMLILGGLVQPSKTLGCYDGLEGAVDYVIELMQSKPDSLYLTGPGRTVKYIHMRLNIPYTLLGVDAVYRGKVIGLDLDYLRLLRLVDSYEDFSIIITPIGGQGILFGRGNHQFGRKILKRLNPENLFIIASECKMRDIEKLRVDTGYTDIDAKFKGYKKVITGYREERVMLVE